MASNNGINNQALNGFTASGGTINIANDATSSTTNVGTGNGNKTTNVGSTNIDATTTISGGNGINVNSGTGSINISTDTGATVINIGTGGAVKSLTMGSTTANSSVNIRSSGASGIIRLIGTNCPIQIVSGTEVVNISNDATTNTLNLGTGAGVKTVTLGSTNTTSTTTVAGGTGGVQISGTFLNMPTTTSTVGQLRINNTRVLHSYQTSGTGLDFFVGTGAGNFTGSSAFGGNTACGASALSAITSTWASTAVGANSLLSLTSGLKNTGIGYDTIRNITTGAENTALGHEAGFDLDADANYNICINSRGVSGDDNTLRIGAGTGTGAKQLNKSFISGIFGKTVGVSGIPVVVDNADQLGTVVSSIRYKENIEDMNDASSRIIDLRPVMFDYKENHYQYKVSGLIAEEVAEIMPQLVVHNKEGEVESVKYQDLSVLLLNELQKALKRIEELEKIVRK